MTNTIELIETPYRSVQGEGSEIGKPMIFVRTALCPVNCKWCDSQYTFQRGTEWSFEKLRDKIDELNCSNIWLTGGEPLIRARELSQFIDYMPPVFTWYICTSGAYFNDNVKKLLAKINHICLDYKLKSAQTTVPTNEKFMNYVLGERRASTELKCVIETEEDWEEVYMLAEMAHPDVSLTVQPMFGAVIERGNRAGIFSSYGELQSSDLVLEQTPQKPLSEWAEQFLKRLGEFPNVRFLTQFHKQIWPDKVKGI